MVNKALQRPVEHPTHAVLARRDGSQAVLPLRRFPGRRRVSWLQLARWDAAPPFSLFPVKDYRAGRYPAAEASELCFRPGAQVAGREGLCVGNLFFGGPLEDFPP